MATKRLLLTLLLITCTFFTMRSVASAHGTSGDLQPPLLGPAPMTNGTVTAAAACAGGPTIDGITLDECITRNFTVGGTGKSVTVWYTKNVATAMRTEDGTTYTLEHWINSDGEAEQVAEWFEEAWQRYFADSGHHLYDTGCSNNLNIRMEDGIGWSGIAYWASSGNCWIGIDSPTVRNGGGQWTVYHEAQHYLQYSYNDGCYGYLKPNYPADSEFVEGYADLGSDTVDATLDISGYAGINYDAGTSMYDKSYGNLFNKYFIEQLGTIGAVTDPWHNIDALYAHYSECDDQNTLYVLDDLIPALGGISEKQFFLNFFAANWAKNWADPTTQPELVYFDDDVTDTPWGSPTLTQNVNMASGSQSWPDTTPDDWAAKYYQITPQSGCNYLQMEVDGAAGASLGINFMAAKTGTPTKVLRSAKVGEDYVRTFAAAGVHDRLLTAVNSFANNYGYTVNATCVSPTVNILEPRQVNFAMVGAPDSPIAFLGRWEVTDGTSTVRGLPESSFTFKAGSDPITVVPGTFQEVGNQYWAILLPPVKPAGTTFVSFETCLDAICDTETNALLYVNPGNTDIALTVDASGSMSTEDTIGEGTRLDNAKRAGGVVADLLRPGDRVLVTDFSAFNNPVGCGMPGGDGNCALDLRTLLSRRDVTPANQIASINDTRTAINNISAREWTPVSEGLVDAKNKLLNLPSNTNPKHIFLLSDGEENVRRLYADLRGELIASGVVINTIAFGPEAPGNLLAQIAADTGGIYRPVATNGSGAGMVMAASADAQNAIDALDLVDGMAATFAAPFLPGQLGLANVYDYLDTNAQDAARVIHMPYTNVPAFDATGSIKEMTVNVDKSVNQLRLVVAGKQPDDEGCTFSDVRKVEVKIPGMDPKERWIPISPRNSQITPAEWEIVNNRFDDILIVTNPAEGPWQFRTYYYPTNCIPLQAASPSAPSATTNGGPYAFFMNVSVQSTMQLEGRLLGLTNNQGSAGDVVTIVGTIVDRNGTVKPTAMAAQVEGPTGAQTMLLYDDGAHNDGSAGDNIYAALYGQTALGGSYSVRLLAAFKDPANPANNLFREWNGGFWIKGPKGNDLDNDGMPDDWERRCKLDIKANDAKNDNDQDGLTNLEEFQLGTLPCRADTDKGGENDGSEVRNGRNPLEAKDDKVRPLGHINVRPLNSRILIDWRRPLSYTNTLVFVSTNPDQVGDPVEMGQQGDFMLDNLTNDQTYYIRLVGVNDDARGDYSEPIAVTPKADPDAPAGAMLIENGKPTTISKQVVLNISSTDTPLAGAAQGANGHLTDQFSLLYNTVSGATQMRLSNNGDMAGAEWEPIVPQRGWTLACEIGETCTVFAQFRDAAGNESLIINDFITLEGVTLDQQLFLPMINR